MTIFDMGANEYKYKKTMPKFIMGFDFGLKNGVWSAVGPMEFDGTTTTCTNIKFPEMTKDSLSKAVKKLQADHIKAIVNYQPLIQEIFLKPPFPDFKRAKYNW